MIVTRNNDDPADDVDVDKADVSGNHATNDEEISPPATPTLLSPSTHRKNIYGLSIAFVLVFTANASLSYLQSTLNFDEGLGLTSLSVKYACTMVSCLFAPVIVRVLGTKWSIVISLICYSLYTPANFYPDLLLVPAAALMGLAGGPLWTGQGTYLTTLGYSLAGIIQDKPKAIISQFNGIFNIFFQSNNIFGNLLSGVIFTLNATKTHLTQTDIWKCGRNGTGKEGGNFENPGVQQTNLLITIYLILGVLGVLVATLFIESIPSGFLGQPKTKTLTKHLVELVGVMKTHSIVLMIPMMIYSGVEQAFITGSFTKSFISCTIGIQGIGYVMIVYGVAGSISSYGIGRVRAFVSRKLIFTSGGVVNLVIIVWMLLWRGQENVEQGYQFYLMAAGWAFSNAVWEVQVTSLLGLLMPRSQEAVFATHTFWASAGSFLSFSASVADYVTELHKLVALLVLLLVAFIFYYIVECLITKHGLIKTDCFPDTVINGVAGHDKSSGQCDYRHPSEWESDHLKCADDVVSYEQTDHSKPKGGFKHVL